MNQKQVVTPHPLDESQEQLGPVDTGNGRWYHLAKGIEGVDGILIRHDLVAYCGTPLDNYVGQPRPNVEGRKLCPDCKRKA